MKGIILIIVLLINTFAYSQQETYNWYFGITAGITFATSPPTFLPGSQMATSEGCASLSDSNGNLLFYSNGNVIWDRNHNIMPNGTDLNGSLTCSQSALFVPWPGNDSLYFLFTPPDQFTPGSFCYSIVNLTLNNTFGDITNKNTPLFSPSTEKVTAVLHANGTDVWVIGHSFNNADFYAYLITSSGINNNPVISTAGTVHGGDDDNNLGIMKASPCGDKFALVVQSNFAELFNFDNATGIVSHPVFLGDYSPFNPWGIYGIEFSPGGTKLYLTQENPALLVQYDLLAGSDSAIVASADTIVYLPTKYFGGLQLGPDGKIYISRFMPAIAGDFLSCINQPENAGIACDFVDMCIVFNVPFSGAVHALPNFMSSYFCNTPTPLPIANFTVVQNNLCDSVCVYFTDSTSGNPISWQWNFPGATTSTSTLQNPMACYSQSGPYLAQLVTCNAAGCDSVTINFSIVIEQPSVSLGNDTTICAGDTIQLTANTGYTNYEWQYNFMPVDSNIIAISAYREGNYSIVVTDSNGCKAYDTISVEFVVKPEAAFSYYYELNCKGLLVQFNNESINASNYQWNFSDGTVSTEIHPQHQFNLSQNLTAQLISFNGGCADTFILENLFFEYLGINDIPTIFTPNNDGYNDCFQVNSLIRFQNCLQMHIYNRWGQLVFESSDANPCWAGLNTAGKEVAEGVYFVVLTVHDMKYAAAIHLLR